mmetsp:Transcript_121341/g.338660  ORF Transcript_121341/g.338660 Transcript_121341/m.338660 type:complete len:265 (-) Transcript_121341:110-904(-)|eukprot:CAMPEP_0179075268 /NCGR_PEP_ID=MMETSP0796-20121207/33507_1 /TAXON_ID=73915 /ORGANISM="Pyrodinium bahamense, Strain pbaha01" /LENGTH=264 /DNA_ID=CAMNT_0020772503 /DNA_START=96 /DNA_END=890 /DNA_ORIENTATION=-
MAAVWGKLQKAGRRWSQSGSAGVAGNPEVQERLLCDPVVMEAVRGAGLQALLDPGVRRAVRNAAAEKAPEVAGQAAALVKAWSSDPEVQARARYVAGMAVHCTGHAGEAVVHCIEQGPEGVQVLAFVGSGASLALAGLQVLNPLAAVGAAISLYQVLFSLMMMVFEAKTEWISRYEFINDLHDMLMLNLRFLSLSLGRGLFYIFQGSMWWVLSSFFGIPQKLLALYMCFLGTLYILMHFGVMPQHVATKMRAFADGEDYIRVAD